MASNKELTAEAAELAEELGIEITTDGMNNKALSALVSDLKAKKKDAELQTQADGDQSEESEGDADGDQSNESEGDADGDQSNESEGDADGDQSNESEGDADGDQSNESEGDADGDQSNESEGDADGDQSNESEGDADGDQSEEGRAPGVYIADGKAVTSKIGVLSEGRAVEAKHFAGGQKTLDNLIKRGHCVKVD
ncbi:FKBP-type peptidyl-prolyl cis-trans isomerase [Oceanospirillum phage vB_OsaM_PD0307]|nr:FKBP-type peptidyl-prolyl cis-trans isomerase [Oceanospirillum phage vB_OsaM_PD0307]